MILVIGFERNKSIQHFQRSMEGWMPKG